MATIQKSPELPRPSFAKVAASVSKSDNTKTNSSTSDLPNAVVSSTTKIHPESEVDTCQSVPRPISAMVQPVSLDTSKATDGNTGVNKVAASINALDINAKVPSLVIDGSEPVNLTRPLVVASRESASDESQRADSSSDLGTKPPSVDEKSITSGTTFGLDEKESLRPDDSASVKAAAEDDDTYSIRGSLIAGSRIGSEVAGRARGGQLGDIPERKSLHYTQGAPPQGIMTPQSVSSEQPPRVIPTAPLSGAESSDALNVIYRQAPDEKLLDALSSTRDRYFLLRLEKDVIDFVQDSKEPYMDLPPSNSFCRMLTHKLADYYHMTHSYEQHIGSVRIFRTPFCRVPPSLATMVPQPNSSTSSTPPPAILPRKIMRRGQDTDGIGSANASKPTSESGSEAKDNKDNKPVGQKLSREEREEMYKLARERIFGSSEDSIPENESDAGMSRTSSMSATNKANAGKRGKTNKQRRDDSDRFESRHQYMPYWGPQQPTWAPQSHAQYNTQGNGPYTPQHPQQSYAGPITPVYGPQSPAYANMPAAVPTGTAYPTYHIPQQYPPQAAQQRYPQNGSPMTTYGSPVPAAAPAPNWQPGFAPTYQGRGPAPPVPQNHVGIPYAYGQLPANANPHDPKSQHPIPGSYSRNPPGFNPQTQSFVPAGSNMPPVQPPQPPFTAPGSHHGSPQIGTGTPHLPYAGYGATPQPYGGGYGMARQGSNTSIPAYHSPQHATPPHVQHPPTMPNPQHVTHQHITQQPPPHIPSRPHIPQGPNQGYSHLPTYGNPATLPQKPATGI